MWAAAVGLGFPDTGSNAHHHLNTHSPVIVLPWLACEGTIKITATSSPQLRRVAHACVFRHTPAHVTAARRTSRGGPWVKRSVPLSRKTKGHSTQHSIAHPADRAEVCGTRARTSPAGAA